MSKAKTPVTVAGIEFDALISSDHTMEATVPEYTVESGFTISDAIILGEETLSMVLYLTNTPVTWYERHGSDTDRVSSICSQLQTLYYTAEPVTVVTTDETYTDMAIESITISKNTETGYAREIPISFRKVRTTATQTTTIPSDYGKSGTTSTSAGTANTSTASTTSSTSSSSSSDSSSDTKSSILYSVAQAAGIIS